MSAFDFLIFVLILALNAFFCAAETAMTGAQESKLAAMNDRRATMLLKLMRRRSSVISALLVGQNIVGAVLAVYSAIVVAGLVGDSMHPFLAAGIAIMVSIGLLLVFGEVIPKSLVVAAPTAWALAFAWPVVFICRLFRPITFVLEEISKWLLKLIGGTRVEPTLTVEEIQAIARMGLAAGAIDEIEGKVVAKAAMLNDTHVSEIMIPRTDIQGLEINTPLSDIRALFQKSPYSRIPVYRGDLDDIVGILHYKEFFRHAPERARGFDIASFLHKALFVPESMFIGDLLTQMRAKRSHMAIVIDEYGGTSGLTTLEDVVEMLVGRIEDEYDPVDTPVERIDETTWQVDGRVIDERLVAWLGLEMPPEALEGFDTVAGLALKAFGNIPAEGDVTTYYGLEITVLRVTGHRVRRVKIRVLSPEEAAAAEQARQSARRRPTQRITQSVPKSGDEA